MSRTPPPLPSDSPSPGPPIPVRGDVPERSPVPPVPPRRTPKSKLDRRLGDLSDEEIAFLFPPEDDEDEPARESLPPKTPTRPDAVTPSPPLPSAPPVPPPLWLGGQGGPGGPRTPPPPSSARENLPFIPPPVLGKSSGVDDEQPSASPSPRRSRWASQGKTLLWILLASFASGLILIALAVLLSPDRLQKIGPQTPESAAAAGSGPESAVSAVPVPKAEWSNIPVIDFIDPDEEGGEEGGP